MMYVPIIGGLASGKSTALEVLRAHYPAATILSEAAATVLAKHKRLNGLHGAQQDATIPCEIATVTRARLFDMSQGYYGAVAIEESGLISAAAHFAADGYSRLARQAKDDLIHALASLDTRILFIDTPPSFAWPRREAKYRGQAEEMVRCGHAQNTQLVMTALRTRMDRVYAEIALLYEQLPVDAKIRISNQGTLEEYRTKLSRTIGDLL